jgi:hypothetical protein
LGVQQIGLRSYGVDLAIECDSALVEALTALLPPGWVESGASLCTPTFCVGRDSAGLFRIEGPGGGYESGDRAATLGILADEIRLHVATYSREGLFVHSGVVACKGRAVMIPGRSFAGKSTLVAALLRVGATYYSDEFAVLDTNGCVRPYAQALALRSPGNDLGVPTLPESLGAPVGLEAIPVAAVVMTGYAEGATWQPRVLSPGQAMLALIDNTVAIRRIPKEALEVLRRVTLNAVCVRTPRGDASEAARHILDLLERPSSDAPGDHTAPHAISTSP